LKIFDYYHKTPLSGLNTKSTGNRDIAQAYIAPVPGESRKGPFQAFASGFPGTIPQREGRNYAFPGALQPEFAPFFKTVHILGGSNPAGRGGFPLKKGSNSKEMIHPAAAANKPNIIAEPGT
jgi:hypothetical protein